VKRGVRYRRCSVEERDTFVVKAVVGLVVFVTGDFDRFNRVR